MIGILIFNVSVLILGVTFKVFNFKNYLSEPDEYVRWVNAGENVPRVPSTILGSGTSMIYNPR